MFQVKLWCQPCLPYSWTFLGLLSFASLFKSAIYKRVSYGTLTVCTTSLRFQTRGKLRFTGWCVWTVQQLLTRKRTTSSRSILTITDVFFFFFLATFMCWWICRTWPVTVCHKRIHEQQIFKRNVTKPLINFATGLVVKQRESTNLPTFWS